MYPSLFGYIDVCRWLLADAVKLIVKAPTVETVSGPTLQTCDQDSFPPLGAAILP